MGVRVYGLWVCGCVGVWVYGCICVSMYGMWASVSICVCVYVCMGVWAYVCMCVCVYVCMGVWVYGRMGVWVYGCGCMGVIVSCEAKKRQTDRVHCYTPIHPYIKPTVNE